MNVKKTIALALCAMFVLLTMTACKGSVPKEFKGHLMAPYIEQIQDGVYTYESAKVGQEDAKTTFCKAAEDKVMITISTADNTACMMRNGDNYYVVSPAQFAYTDATGAVKKQIAAYTTSLSIENWVAGSFVEDGTTTVAGVDYQYEDYYIASTQKRVRFLFNQDDDLCLVGQVKTDGTIKEYLTINIYAASTSGFDSLNKYRYYNSDGTAATNPAITSSVAAAQ